MHHPLAPGIEDLITLALAEDLGPGDVTTEATVEPTREGSGTVVAREALVVSGVTVAARVFERVGPDLLIDPMVKDGDLLVAGAPVLRVSGRLAPILSAERLALNFLQRLSGIATRTAHFVDALGEGRTRLLDTRKTTPGLRLLEKAAVRHGGGHNHRIGLFDGVMIKDNHIVAAGGITIAVERARERVGPLTRIEVEVEDLAGLEEAITAGAEMVMLDNMDDARVAEAVEAAGGRVLLEVSGGVTLERLPRLARAGVDYVSIGSIIHGAQAVDLALDLNG
ncbi:MAG: carboxylating nicotinate-nucleotide diphosphorylase [Deltaproteobacteria bacterium]|nr:carboxylating nicotinate-nucleotide diphosphorylase [Deltaproteobacteria bacterium]